MHVLLLMLMEEADTNVDFKGEQKNREHNLLTLPNELLVYIISLLTITRDKVKLRCVSRKFRSVCNTPSLWRTFIWPNFDIREENCVRNVLKSCGQFINRLSFPHHVMPSKLTILQ